MKIHYYFVRVQIYAITGTDHEETTILRIEQQAEENDDEFFANLLENKLKEPIKKFAENNPNGHMAYRSHKLLCVSKLK